MPKQQTRIQKIKKDSKKRSEAIRKSNYRPQAQIAAPVAYSQKQVFPNRERMTSRRIRNSEFVSTIQGSVAFSADQKFVINPGLSATFPWLSVLAAEWQQYRIHRLCFRYVTRTSTSSVGSVILSPDYNVVDSPPGSETIASNTQDAVEDVCWRSITCNLDTSAMFPLGPRKQIRVGNINGDYTTYDAGRMFVCVGGQTSTNDIGKLWVDYDIELFVPQSSGAQSVSSGTNSSFFRLSGNQSISTGVLTKVVFDTADVNTLSVVNSSGVFTPPAGNYIVSVGVATSSSAATQYTVNYQWWKNGSNNLAWGTAELNSSAGTSTASLNNVYVSANGTDTYELQIVITASGTLNILASMTNLFWRLA